MKSLSLAFVTLLIASCGEDELLTAARADEARMVGYYIGIAERCGPDARHSKGIPSLYDDSRDDGKMSQAFLSGYQRALREDRPCIHGIQGR